jgi:hypothetical protein
MEDGAKSTQVHYLSGNITRNYFAFWLFVHPNILMTHLVLKSFTLILCLAALAGGGCKKQPQASDKETALPGRHMSEHQVVDIAMRELPKGWQGLGCEFKDGVWEISEIQKDVWGVSSAITNADGKVVISSTNATRVVLRIRDADGKVERVKTP